MAEAGRIATAELVAPIAGATVAWQDAAGHELAATTSDPDGNFALERPAVAARLVVAAAGFATKILTAIPASGTIRLIADRLRGYHDRLEAQPGLALSCYVHAPAPFRAALVRHGAERQVVAELGSFPAQTQEVPDAPFVATGLDWRESFRTDVPAAARPGLYSVDLADDEGRRFAVPLAVTTPAVARGRGPRLLVLFSSNNWQTYNTWGGRSRYRNFETDRSRDFIPPPSTPWSRLRRQLGGLLPPQLRNDLKARLGMRRPPPPPWIHDWLSVRRPFTNCGLEDARPEQPFANHLAGGEWRVLAWLERAGYDYDVATGWELHRTPDLLAHYDAIVLSTHCEYWSRSMYEALVAAHHERGLWILNLSGNAIYREVDFADDGRAIRCTSAWFADSVADETQLIGVRYREEDYGTCAAYRIEQPRHWAFAGLSTTRGQVFGATSLNRNVPARGDRYDPGRPGLDGGLRGDGASGWETDKLSATAPRDFVRIAKGQNRHGGADMVVRDPAGPRGGVFSASSITFGGSLLIDEVAAGVVRNVLDRALGARRGD